jgi:hypothetical protein
MSGTPVPPYTIRPHMRSQAGVSKNYANDISFTQILNIFAPTLVLSQARKHERAYLLPIKEQ